jgi:ketosteroid isomerase-like protein
MRGTLEIDSTLPATLDRVQTALSAIKSGDPGPYIDCFADREDVTLFGAWGPVEQGPRALEETFRWVASRFSGGDATVENLVVASSGDLAYTVGFERGTARVDDGPEIDMTIRVTHIYRRVGAEWKLVHRHADFPPADQRTG